MIRIFSDDSRSFFVAEEHCERNWQDCLHERSVQIYFITDKVKWLSLSHISGSVPTMLKNTHYYKAKYWVRWTLAVSIILPRFDPDHRYIDLFYSGCILRKQITHTVYAYFRLVCTYSLVFVSPFRKSLLASSFCLFIS